jgi:putative ABC transport system ATP-binding protein
MGPMIELRGVDRFFPPAVDALTDVSFAVDPGERVAIMGPSGSGKTTLLNILGLLDQPSDGSYAIDGFETSQLTERQRCGLRAHSIGFVFQSFHLVPHLTSEENVELGLQHTSFARGERRERAREALVRVGLDHRLASFPPVLSGGERQRVAIARACVKDPRILLCDEPTGNLDSQTGDAVLEQILGVVGPDQVLIMVTHDADVGSLADRVIAMRDGTVVG